MDATDLSKLLTALNPADLRQRIAELDRERSALAVLLRAATARHHGRSPAPRPAPERREAARAE